MEPTQYEICTLDDFQKVPEDRLDDCLFEFKTAVNMQRSMSEIFKAVGEGLGLPSELINGSMPRFVWIDDGERNATIRMVEPLGGE